MEPEDLDYNDTDDTGYCDICGEELGTDGECHNEDCGTEPEDYED